MTWTPCPVCGADGYKVRPSMLGWTCNCPACDSVLLVAESLDRIRAEVKAVMQG